MLTSIACFPFFATTGAGAALVRKAIVARMVQKRIVSFMIWYKRRWFTRRKLVIVTKVGGMQSSWLKGEGARWKG